MEIIINAGVFIMWVYAAYLFFSKKKEFPKIFIGLAVFSLVFILVDALSIKIVMPNEPIFDPDTIKEVMRGLIMVVIWVPYMMRSKRVQATFIR